MPRILEVVLLSRSLWTEGPQELDQATQGQMDRADAISTQYGALVPWLELAYLSVCFLESSYHTVLDVEVGKRKLIGATRE